jgi:drug/metabolite transporter (DMT)-like permease
MRTPSPARPYLALGLGIPVVSIAAILITFARMEGVPALAIASLRLAAAALVVAPLALLRARREIFRMGRRDALLAAGAGLFLALHFASWISSLERTSVMSSVVLVSMNPLFVGLASLLLLREKPGPWTWAGIAAAVGGALVIGLADLGRAGPGSLTGDLLALLGALAASGYLLLGRAVRRRVSLLAYIGVAYTTAAVLLLAAALAAGVRLTGYPWKAYLWIVLLAAGPQLIGHTVYNYALRWVSATFVTVTLLSEPIGATLLAIPLLSQVPSPVALVGGLAILAGILFSARGERMAARAAPG